jgi:hypothetical protein
MTNSGLPDLPIDSFDDETLEIRAYAEALAQFIMECDTPMTIAIQGDWGSGKTSMMNLVKAAMLAQYPGKACPVWFNTWQYSQFNAQDQLGLSLLTHFITEVAGESRDNREQMLNVLAGVGRFAAIAGSMWLTGSADGARGLQEGVAQPLGPVEAISKLKRQLDELTEKRRRAMGVERVVVFIDDLDRLVPERAVELLEVFKLFLDVKGCVFVLACDYQVIAQGLQKKFGIGERELKGKSFFDKIIQLPFSMPVSQYDTGRYTRDLLTRIGITAQETDLETYKGLITKSVGLNPRSMKRLFNAFQLISLVAAKKEVLKDTDAATRDERQRILLACLCLQTAFEPVYRHLIDKGSELTANCLTDLKALDPEGTDADLCRLSEDLGGGKGQMMQRLPAFIESFIAAVQLASDSKEELSDKEMHNLAEILSFSSITATTSTVLVPEGGGRDSLLLKRTLDQLATCLNDEHAEQLDELSARFKVAKAISRTGLPYGALELEGAGWLCDRKRVQVSCGFDARGEWAGVHMTASNFKWLCEFMESKIGKIVPYQEPDRCSTDDGCYWLAYGEMDGAKTLEEQLSEFEGTVRDALAKVIPTLAGK